MLPADTQGMSWAEPWAGFGMRGNASRLLQLEDARIHRRDLLGSEGDELWYLFNVIAPYFLMAMSGSYFGVANAAFAFTREHVAKRAYPHGSSLGQQPIVQHRSESCGRSSSGRGGLSTTQQPPATLGIPMPSPGSSPVRPKSPTARST